MRHTDEVDMLYDKNQASCDEDDTFDINQASCEEDDTLNIDPASCDESGMSYVEQTDVSQRCVSYFHDTGTSDADCLVPSPTEIRPVCPHAIHEPCSAPLRADGNSAAAHADMSHTDQSSCDYPKHIVKLHRGKIISMHSPS